MRFSRKAAGLVAVGGVAALGIGLIGASGIGAAFTSNATATAKIDVGTFNCSLNSSDSSVSITNNGHKATVNLGTISSSNPSSVTAPLTVKNTGSIDALVSWSISTTGNIANTHRISPVAAPSTAALQAGGSADLSIGFEWSELENSDLGRTGSAIYTVECTELPVPTNFTMYKWHGNGIAMWDGTQATLGVPEGDAGGAGINLLNPPSTLPSTEPTFTAGTYQPGMKHPGSVRFNIDFSDGSYVRGFPTELGYWSAVGTSTNPAPSGHLSWQQVLNKYATSEVVQVQIAMDNSWNGYQTNITCLNYASVNYIGSGTCS